MSKRSNRCPRCSSALDPNRPVTVKHCSSRCMQADAAEQSLGVRRMRAEVEALMQQYATGGWKP